MIIESISGDAKTSGNDWATYEQQFMALMAARHIDSRGWLEMVPPLFVRAAWKAAVAAQYDEDGIDCFVETELKPLAQWFFISGSYRHIEPGLIKAGWDNLRRLPRESVLAEARKLGKDDWPPIVRRDQTVAGSNQSGFSRS